MTYNLNIESYVLFGVLTEDYRLETESQIAVGNCSKEVREESGYLGISAEKQAFS